MASAEYMLGRKKYSRPQAVLFANNPGTISIIEETQEQYYVPDGYEELGQQPLSGSESKFIILSDDNRQQLDFNIQRIERRERMINGRMRSYHIADKLSLTMSWTMLPSRSAIAFPGYDELSGVQTAGITSSGLYTSDGGAGGVEILDWYENTRESFWVYLSYDKYNSYGSINSGETNTSMYNNLPKYSQVVEMYFSDFSYSVVKRGGSNFDFWDISISLEEV